MSDHIQIRQARGEDADAVLRMITEHAIFEGEHFEPEGKIEKLRAGLAEQKPFESFVVEIDGQLEGYCIYMVHYDSWHQASHLFVDGLWLNVLVRGASIGTQIFEKLHERARLLGCASIQVMTPSTNDSGISFYKKLGATQSAKAYFTLATK